MGLYSVLPWLPPVELDTFPCWYTHWKGLLFLWCSALPYNYDILVDVSCNFWILGFPSFPITNNAPVNIHEWKCFLFHEWVRFPSVSSGELNICITLLVMLNSARHSAVFQQWLHQQVLLSAVDGSLSGSVPFMESSETSHTTFILWLISSTDFPISFRGILDLHWILISN